METYLVYDGGCGVCTFAKGLVRALDWRRRIRPVSLRDPESERLLAGMSPEGRWSSFHLVQGGRTTSRGDGVINLIGALPFGRGIPRLAAEAPIVRSASERVYSLAHGVRNALACEV